MLTTAGVLNQVLTRIQDNSEEMRARLLAWFNVVGQMLYLERDWMCLEKVQRGIAIATNAIPKPTDYGRFVYAKHTTFFLQENDRLSDQEIADTEEETEATTSTVATGFHEDADSIFFLPGAAGTADLKYQREIPAYVDDDTETVWPDYFLPLYERSLLDAYYEFDRDNRLAVSVQLDAGELLRLKEWENRQKPKPKLSPQGYLRDRR
jgi:hypothetical protein